MLAEILARWRESRHVELADAIDRLTGSAAPIDGKTVGARHAAWLDVADASPDAAAIGRLLATPMPGTAAMRAQMLERLLALPDDPRVAMALVRCFEVEVFPTRRFRAVARRAIDRLVELRDQRVLPRLRAYLGRPRRWNIDPAWLPRIEALAALAFPPSDEDRAAIAAITAPVDPLYDALVAQPDDLEAYAVYADALTQRGDPRGEFMALQLAAAPDEANLHRQRALIEAHGRAWAGALDRWFLDAGRVFEHGMFAGGRLAADSRIDAAEPGWAFVRTIETFADRDAEVAATLVRLPRVVRAGVFTLSTGPRLAGGELAPRLPNLRELHVDAGVPGLEEQLATCSALPALEVLGLRNVVDAPRWIAQAPVLDRISHLVINQATHDTWVALATRRSPTLRTLVQLVELDGFADRDGWRAILRRAGDSGPFDDVTLEYTGAEAGTVSVVAWLLERLPVAWPRTIVVRGRVAAMAQHADELARFERAVARFTTGPSVDVPFARATRDAAPARVIHAQLPKATALDAARFPLVFRALEGFDQHFATFTVNKSSTQRPLGKDPVARVLGWIAKRLDATVLRDPRGEAIARLSDVDISTLTLALGERTLVDACAWFADFVAIAGAPTGALGSEVRTFPFAVEGHVEAPPAAWFMVFDTRARALLATATADELAAIAPLATIALTETRATVRVGDDPADATPERLAALSTALVACFDRAFTRLHGFAFRERVVEAFAGLVAHYDLERRATHAHSVAYHRLEGASIGMIAELEIVDATPRLTVTVHRFPPPPHIPPMGKVVRDRPVTTAAELAAALADAVSRIAELFAA